MRNNSRVKLLPKSPSAYVADSDRINDRDRVIDSVRALALVIMVAGHFVMGVVGWRDGVPVVGNLLAAFPLTQLVTWLFQIMPLFFWAGGAANALSWRNHRTHSDSWVIWIWHRTQRLMRPLWWYLGIMGIVAWIVTLSTDEKFSAPLLKLTTQLVWFMGVYLMMTAATPWLVRICITLKTYGAVIFIVLVGTIDFARFTLDAPEAVALLNFIFVWLVPTYFGTLYVEDKNAIVTGFRAIALGITALAVNALLITHGPYPLSMVGMPGEKISNMAPPTLALALHSLFLVSIISFGYKWITMRPISNWLWTKIMSINLVAMTLYLWHLPMLVILIMTTHALQIDRPTIISPSGYPLPIGMNYLFLTIPFVLLFIFLVWLIVRIMWPLEHLHLPLWDAPLKTRPVPTSVTNVIALFSIVAIGISALALSATGLAGFPTRIIYYAGIPVSALVAISLMMISGFLLRWVGGDRIGSSHFDSYQ